MNRRSFMQRLASATALIMAAGAATVTLEGCTVDIKSAIDTVLNSALAILKVAEPNAAWAGELANAIAKLQQAETTWAAGGAAAIVVDALNTVEAVIAVIPITAPYAPLVDILVAGIEAVMSAFGLVATAYAGGLAKRKTVVNSAHFGRAHLNGPSFTHPSWQGAYKAQWNAKAKELNLPAAEIK